MTYKLEPGLARITSPVLLIFPDGKEQKFESGKKACDAVFDHRYHAVEILAEQNTVHIRLEEPAILSMTWIGEEQSFF